MSAAIAARRLIPLALGTVGFSACAPVDPGPGLPQATLAEPEIRIAIVVAVPAVEVGGGGPLTIRDETGRVVLELPAGVSAAALAAGDRVAIHRGSQTIGGLLGVELSAPAEAGLIRAGGNEYRGTVSIAAGPTGLLVVNRLPIEDYLPGVVNAEMGRRGPAEQAALEAQAIVSRSVALRAQGRYRTRGYDLLATVADQVYRGVSAELEQGRQAVASTRGLVLTWEGQPIDAFFHSTCAGRTASGEEVYANGARPYLQSAWDTAPDGTSWCAISPRFAWSESWDGARLSAMLGRSLPPLGLPPGAADAVADLSLTAHTSSGRVHAMTIRFRDQTRQITGSSAVRQVFLDDAGRPLRSAAFRLMTTRAGPRLTRVVVEGSGAGHGVGMCQWGAVGRARAGQSASRILAAYFPGASLERRW